MIGEMTANIAGASARRPFSSSRRRTQKDALPFCQGVPITLKSLRNKDYLETPQTLGQHLRKWRRQLGLLQREAASQMGVCKETYVNWENDKAKPVTAQFKPVVQFLGYDPTPEPTTLVGRLEAKRRTLGATFDQVAAHLGWDRATLTRYLNGTWRIPANRMAALEAFLSAATSDLTDIRRLPRRLRRFGRAASS